MRYIYLIVLGILIFGCTTAQPEKDSAENTAVETVGTKTDNAVTGFDMAKCQKDCDFFKDVDIKKSCLGGCHQDSAIANKDPDRCDPMIEELGLTLTYYEICLEEVGKETGDWTVCKKIDTEPTRDMCYLELAQYFHDPSICDNVGVENVVLKPDDCKRLVE